MQIGFIFSPIISQRKYFVWNNVAFINMLEYTGDEVEDHERQTWMVASAIPSAVVNKASDLMGSRKLGEVFRRLASNGELAEFRSLLNFATLLRAKPKDWEPTAIEIIHKTGRRALYLRYMLAVAMRQYHEEVNTQQERSALKRVVATIRSKRELSKDAPGSKMVSSVLKKLEERSFFEKKKPSN